MVDISDYFDSRLVRFCLVMTGLSMMRPSPMVAWMAFSIIAGFAIGEDIAKGFQK